MRRRDFLISIPTISAAIFWAPALFGDTLTPSEDGIGAPGKDPYLYVPDLNGPDPGEIIAGGLARRGKPSPVIEKVLGANFQRVLGDIRGTA